MSEITETQFPDPSGHFLRRSTLPAQRSTRTLLTKYNAHVNDQCTHGEIFPPKQK